MTDEASFLAAIAANPGDQNLPLIFADWLDDHGDPRGQWIRNWSVRYWMGPKLENPIPKLLEAITKDRRIMRVRRVAAVIGEPLVPGLIELLKHEKSRARLQACHCLRKIGPRAKAAVPALMDALADSDYSVRAQVASALAAIGADETAGTEQLKAALTDENWTVRRTASKVLGAMGAKGNVLDELVERFNSPDAKDRAEVIEGLAQLGTANVIPYLDRATDDSDATVRVDAVRALGRLKLPGAAPPLCRAMRSTEPAVREAAAQQFSGWRPNVPVAQEVLDALAVLLADRDGRVRAVACDALRQSAARAAFAVPALLKNLDHDAPSVRSAAASALGAVTRDDRAVIDALAEAIADTDLSVAVAAVSALAVQTKLPARIVPGLFAFIRRVRADEGVEYHVATAYTAFAKLDAPPPEVIAELRRALAPPATPHRYNLSWQAAQALSELGPAALPAAPQLLAAVREHLLSEPGTRALLKMGGAGVEGLIALLDSNDEDVRSNTISLLWNVGPLGLPLVPALLRCVRRTADDGRRARAIYGVQYIGPTATGAIPDLLEQLTGSGSQSAVAALNVLTKFGAALVPHLPQLVEVALDPARAHWRGTFAELFANLAPETPAVLEPLRELVRAAGPDEADAKDWNARWAKRSVRDHALRGFAALGSEAAGALPEVAPLVTDPEVEIRRSAANVLTLIDAPGAVPLLCRALADIDEAVRFRAAEALAGKGDTSDETVAALVHAVGDRETKVRRAAIDALNKLKVSTPGARAALAEATRDDDKKVAERAAVALRKLTPKGAGAKVEEGSEAAPKAKAPKAKRKKKAE
jgi:uncharacterized protein (TIGR02996 family)